MIQFKKNKELLKYTESFERIQKGKDKIEKLKKENIKTGKNVFYVLLVLILTFLFLWCLERNKSQNLAKNGILTYGIVKNIVHNHYRMNDMGGEFVDNYNIKYQFKANDKIVFATYEVQKQYYNQYFKKSIHINDTISIRYNPKKTYENEIAKIK